MIIIYKFWKILEGKIVYNQIENKEKLIIYFMFDENVIEKKKLLESEICLINKKYCLILKILFLGYCIVQKSRK